MAKAHNQFRPYADIIGPDATPSCCMTSNLKFILRKLEIA